jgi:hypothetical protein
MLRSRSVRARRGAGALVAALTALVAIGPALASSHREAPAITKTPKVDGTDFYVFNSYEAGRGDYVTLVANYLPLQDPYGGPNYFTLDADARYEIKVDNDGDAVADLTFQFKFFRDAKNFALPIGAPGSEILVEVPLVNIGPIGAGTTTLLNVVETYTVKLFRGSSTTGEFLKDMASGSKTFTKPADNIGNKSIPDYEAYAATGLYDVEIPGCDGGRLFVGQRKDPFVVNLGEVFDLVNIANPIGDPNAETDDLADKNVTSLILEVPKSCLVEDGGPTIGAWTTASLPRTGMEPKTFDQKSRLSSPLVNEVVIGLGDKDRFNGSQPKNDAQFASYVTNPTLPALLEILFGSAGVKAPTLFPRSDLVAAFLTGVPGLNETATPAEMLRLNTSIPAVARDLQSNLGVIGGDVAGFPNGRRPGDDVVDIELRVAMGRLITLGLYGDPSQAPSGALDFTDGASVDATFFDDRFPYLRTPIPGSPRY